MLSAMLDRAGDDRVLLESVLRTLFPVTQEFLSSTTYGPMSNRVWRSQRRVASYEVLRIYLQAGLDELALQSSEVQELVEALTDADGLAQLLDSLDERRFEEALDRLGDFEQDFPLEACARLSPVIADRMGRLSGHLAGPFLIPPRIKASTIILLLLRRIRDQQALAGIMSEVLERTDSLSGTFSLVARVGHRDSIGQKLVSVADARKLEHRLADRLESATSTQLAGEWDLALLSTQTLSWLEGEDKCRLRDKLRPTPQRRRIRSRSPSHGRYLRIHQR